MKTPEQIARETLGADALAGIGYGQYIPYMVAAIEADRAQRAELSLSLGVYDYQHSQLEQEEDADYKVVQIDTEPDVGRIRVYVNDGLVYDGDPEKD